MPFEKGIKNINWSGGRSRKGVYISILRHGHHRATTSGHVREHIIVAENALGKPLISPICIHHINEDKQDNRPNNLVICQNKQYHELLHARIRALKACGNANYRPCKYCHEYDSIENMKEYNSSYHHRECMNKRHREKYWKAKKDEWKFKDATGF